MYLCPLLLGYQFIFLFQLPYFVCLLVFCFLPFFLFWVYHFQDSSEKNGLQEMISQKITVADRYINGLNHENGAKKSDNFIVDLESFSNGLEKEPTTNSTITNSRITLQRSLSRKGPQRGTEKKINDRDIHAPSSSPKGTQVSSTPEKPLSPLTLSMGSPDNSINNQLPQHQITIRTGGMNTVADGRWGKRSSFKRSPTSWFSDPKRILLFFATLSSMGTILLIYFTLSINKSNEKEGVLDWQ